MHPAISDFSMINWLRQQVRIVEAWREELASRPDVDLSAVTRVEQHYHWLCTEMYRLEGEPASVH